MPRASVPLSQHPCTPWLLLMLFILSLLLVSPFVNARNVEAEIGREVGHGESLQSNSEDPKPTSHTC
jgi:hypothetical protein